jgi:hypothetical protein
MQFFTQLIRVLGYNTIATQVARVIVSLVMACKILARRIAPVVSCNYFKGK